MNSMKISPHPSNSASTYDPESYDRVLGRAKEVFVDAGKAEEWLNTPNAALGAKPVSLLVSEDGENTVQQLLSSIEYGATV